MESETKTLTKEQREQCVARVSNKFYCGDPYCVGAVLMYEATLQALEHQLAEERVVPAGAGEVAESFMGWLNDRTGDALTDGWDEHYDSWVEELAGRISRAVRARGEGDGDG